MFKCPEKKRQERIEIGKKYKGTHCDFHAVLFFLHITSYNVFGANEICKCLAKQKGKIDEKNKQKK